MKTLAVIAAATALLGACLFGFGLTSSALASTCGGRYHQITNGKHGFAVLILKDHAVSCPTVTRLGRDLLRGKGHIGARHPGRLDGFSCRYVPVNAGGGEARCTAGRRYVWFGFE